MNCPTCHSSQIQPIRGDQFKGHFLKCSKCGCEFRKINYTSELQIIKKGSIQRGLV